MSNSFSPEKIPVWLRRTPEQQQADQELQDRLRSAQGPGRRPNPTEAHLIRAAAVKRSAEAELNQLRIDENPDPAHVEGAEGRLAEALAAEGRYTEAAELHPNPEHAEHFQKIAAAIDRDDDAPTCNCEVKQAVDPASGQNVILANEIISKMVYSPKHGKMMPLVLCTACGEMNVKPAPEHLQARMDAVRQQHMAEKEKRK